MIVIIRIIWIIRSIGILFLIGNRYRAEIPGWETGSASWGVVRASWGVVRASGIWLFFGLGSIVRVGLHKYKNPSLTILDSWLFDHRRDLAPFLPGWYSHLYPKSLIFAGFLSYPRFFMYPDAYLTDTSGDFVSASAAEFWKKVL